MERFHMRLFDPIPNKLTRSDFVRMRPLRMMNDLVK